MKEYIKTCPWCGETFVTDNPNRWYCSKRCLNAGNKHKLHARTGQTRHDVEPKKDNMKEISRLAKEAMDSHLSYGMYIARRDNAKL